MQPGPYFAANLLAFLVWAWFTVFREVPLNVRMITANGAADDLKAGFHQRRTWVRFWWWLACVAVGSTPLLLQAEWRQALATAPALGILLAGFFLRTFGPLLNHGLKLDYKSRFYASPKSASFPDAYVWRVVRKHWPGQSDGRLQPHANLVNQCFLNMVGLASLVVYAVLTAFYFYG